MLIAIMAERKKTPDTAPTKSDDRGSINQLLGIKGASTETVSFTLFQHLFPHDKYPCFRVHNHFQFISI